MDTFRNEAVIGHYFLNNCTIRHRSNSLGVDQLILPSFSNSDQIVNLPEQISHFVVLLFQTGTQNISKQNHIQVINAVEFLVLVIEFLVQISGYSVGYKLKHSESDTCHQFREHITA